MLPSRTTSQVSTAGPTIPLEQRHVGGKHGQSHGVLAGRQAQRHRGGGDQLGGLRAAQDHPAAGTEPAQTLDPQPPQPVRVGQLGDDPPPDLGVEQVGETAVQARKDQVQGPEQLVAQRGLGRDLPPPVATQAVCAAIAASRAWGRRLPGPTVGRDGARAGLALLGEPVGEESLQGRRDQRHDRATDHAVSWRAAARASSSGAADRYQ